MAPAAKTRLRRWFMPRGIMSPQEVQVAAGGVLIRSMLQGERQSRGDFDRGRRFESFEVDLRC